MNKVILIGRLTSNADLKFFQSGIALSRFSIAIDRNYKKNTVPVTDFIPIEVWGKKAEYCATYIPKGTLVAVVGALHVDKYIDGDGTTKSFTKVVAESITKLSTPANVAVQGSLGIPLPDGEINEGFDDAAIATDTGASEAGETYASMKGENTKVPQVVEAKDDDIPF